MGKKTRHPKKTPDTLTEVELEMMTIIWRKDPCTVAQILAALPPERDLAYTSVSTIVRILEQKGFVTSRKEGRGHLYAAALSKEAFQATSIKHLLVSVFDSTPATLVRRLLASDSLSTQDLAEIKRLLSRGGGK